MVFQFRSMPAGLHHKYRLLMAVLHPMSSCWARGSLLSPRTQKRPKAVLNDRCYVLMSELVAVGYSESQKATLALDAIRHLEKDWISVNDVAVVARDRKGKLRL